MNLAPVQNAATPGDSFFADGFAELLGLSRFPFHLSSNCSNQNPNQNRKDDNQNDEHSPSKPSCCRHFAVGGHGFLEAPKKIFNPLNHAHKPHPYATAPIGVFNAHRHYAQVDFRKTTSERNQLESKSAAQGSAIPHHPSLRGDDLAVRAYSSCSWHSP
jgi:hypothetical protein